ncbi:MAG: hypothetical protein ACR2GY_02340 [Phycisphaerales bacterium]
MIRFFRKYQKVIILVGLPILLVIFLVPQAIQGIADYSSRAARVEATYVDANGVQQSLSTEDSALAQAELNVMSRGLSGFGIVAQGTEVTPLLLLGLSGIEQPEHWMLLKREAEAMGVMSRGIKEAEMIAGSFASIIAQAAEFDTPPTPQQVIGAMAAVTSTSPQTVARALVSARGVQRLLMAYAGSINKLSTRRTAAEADARLNRIDASIMVITPKVSASTEAGDSADAADATANDTGNDTAPEPTEAELEAQLAKYADVMPGEGEHGFGYRLPDRVQVEWLALAASRVREAALDDAKLSRIELRKYWLKNKDRFRPPGVSGEVIFEDVESMVRAEVTEQVVKETLDAIARYMVSEQMRTTRELDRDGIYLKLPEDWSDSQVVLFDLGERVQTEFGALPTYHRRGDEWYSANEVRNLEGVGQAFIERFGQRVTLRDFVLGLKEFGGNETILAQAGVALEPLRLSDGSLYFARITATEKARPPRNVDEVRDKLVADLKRFKAYERLAARAEEIRSEVLALGMEAVADRYDSFVLPQNAIGYAEPNAAILRYGINNTTLPPPIGRDKNTINAIVERGRAAMSSMLERNLDIEELPFEDRVAVIKDDEHLALVVVEFTVLEPTTREDIGVLLQPLADMVTSSELPDQNILESFLSWESVAARFKYARTAGTSNTIDDEGDGEDDDADVADPADADAVAR